MKKYLAGFGGLAVLAAALGAYLLLGPQHTPPAETRPAPAVETPAEPAPEPAPELVPEAAPAEPDPAQLLEELAADLREDLPVRITDTLRKTDAIFLPRMRIMEFVYVSMAPATRAEAGELRGLVEGDAERLCRTRRDMFEMGVTLRHSFLDGNGRLFQRVYLLPEDCRRIP